MPWDWGQFRGEWLWGLLSPKKKKFCNFTKNHGNPKGSDKGFIKASELFIPRWQCG
jgi:hypothetical protein